MAAIRSVDLAYLLPNVPCDAEIRLSSGQRVESAKIVEAGDCRFIELEIEKKAEIDPDAD